MKCEPERFKVSSSDRGTPPTGQHRVKSLNRVSLALHESVTLECFRAFAFGGITLL
jgi:hypothetical protein